jgi:hypothetical protein
MKRNVDRGAAVLAGHCRPADGGGVRFVVALAEGLTADGPTPRSAVLIEKLTVAQLLNFLSFY